MDVTQRNDPMEPSADTGFYSRMLRRSWALILGFVLVGLVLAGADYLHAPRTYQARASVLVTDTGAPQTTAVGERTVGGDVNLDTEARLLVSADVVDRVLSRLGDRVPANALTRQVSVDVPANTTVMDIVFSASSPTLAVDGARAFAQAYLETRAATAQHDVDQLTAVYRRQLTTLTGEQQTLQRDLKAHPGAQRAEIQVRLQTLAQREAATSDALATSETTVVTPGRIINQPVEPRSPSSPNAHLLVPSGGALGLAVGLAVAVTVQRTRPRILDPDDIGRELQLPVLGVIARAPRHDQPLVAGPHTARGLAFVQLNRRLAGSGSDRLFIAPISSEAAALHVAANLAAGLARSGQSARLVVEGGLDGVEMPDDVDVVDLADQPANADAVPADGATTVFALRPSSALAGYVMTGGEPTLVVAVRRQDRASRARRAVAALEADGALVTGVLLHARLPRGRGGRGGLGARLGRGRAADRPVARESAA